MAEICHLTFPYKDITYLTCTNQKFNHIQKHFFFVELGKLLNYINKKSGMVYSFSSIYWIQLLPNVTYSVKLKKNPNYFRPWESTSHLCTSLHFIKLKRYFSIDFLKHVLSSTETTYIVYKCSMLQNINCLQMFNATETTQFVFNFTMLHRQHKVFTNVQCYKDNKNGLQMINSTKTTKMVYNCSMLHKQQKLFTTVQCYRNNRNCLQLFNATETPQIVYRWSIIPKQHTLFTDVQFNNM